MAEAQGALEYLIIISVTLAIVAITTAIVVNSYSTQSSDYAYNSCREAASRCKMAISGNPSEPCLFCNNACNLSDGTEIFSSAVACCALGKASEVYSGSTGTNCVTPTTPICGNKLIEIGESCDNGAYCACPAECPSSCSADCVCPHPASSCLFTSPIQTFDLSGDAYSIAIGDVNYDTQDEIIASVNDSSGNNKLVMYKYNGVSWPQTVIKNTPGLVHSIAIGDIDSDTQNEIVIGMSSPSNQTRSYKYVSGSWVETNISDLPPLFTVAAVYSVAIGNVDGDSYPDVVIGLEAAQFELRMYEKIGASWVETKIARLDTEIWSIDIGDVDRDGKNEVVVGLDTWDYALRMYKNESGTWKEINISKPGNMVRTVSVGNADNDMYTDIVFGGWWSPLDRLRMYTNKSDGWVQQSIGADWGDVLLYSSEIGDVDNDGLNEVVAGGDTAGWSSDTVRMYEYSSGAWIEKEVLGTNARVLGLGIGDVNYDGKNEVVMGLQGTYSNPNPAFEILIIGCG